MTVIRHTRPVMLMYYVWGINTQTLSVANKVRPGMIWVFVLDPITSVIDVHSDQSGSKIESNSLLSAPGVARAVF